MHIFISYAKADTYDIAIQLRDELRQLPDVSVWMDETLEPGESWASQIQREIDAADYVIVLLSPDVNRPVQGKQHRSFVLNEIDYAQQETKLIIPIMVQQTRTPIQLAGIQHIDFTKDLRVGRKKLIDKITSLTSQLSQNSADKSNATESITTPLISKRSTNDFPPVITKITTRPYNSPDWKGFNGKSNNDWRPHIHNFSDSQIADIPFCLVPPGTFQMGNNDREDAEKPMHSQTFYQPFWLSQYPVTNAQWARAVKDNVVQAPIETGDSLKWYNDRTKANAPVVGINWFMARDFAAWLGCRLPTEREWEYAARGPSNLVYPWGNLFVPDNVVYKDNFNNQTVDVGSRPSGNSWVGASDLTGNVWEWVSSKYWPYPYKVDDGRERNKNREEFLHVFRGGSFTFTATDDFRCVDRARGNPNDCIIDLGFRIARDYIDEF